MAIQSIIKSAITGTSAMTLFSYLISEKKVENFREPLVLAVFGAFAGLAYKSKVSEKKPNLLSI